MDTVTSRPTAGISTANTHLVNIEAAAATLRRAAAQALADRRSFPGGVPRIALAGLLDDLGEVDQAIGELKDAVR